jgi:hypothetical protein
MSTVSVGERETIYASARVEGWLEEYAKRKELVAGELIASVARALLGEQEQGQPGQPRVKPVGVKPVAKRGPYGPRRQPKVMTPQKSGARGWARGWGGMTKEQRSAEMKRRMKVAKQNRDKKAGEQGQPKGGVA